jgi:hypothetical protein
MRSVLLCFLTAITALPAGGVTLDETRRALGALRGAEPITVRLVSADLRTDGKDKGESRGTSLAEDDGTYIKLIHEKKGLVRRDEKKRGADHSVSAAEAAELMNFAPSLLKMLEGATLRKTTPAQVNGRPATLFEVVPVREKDEDGDKWVKNYVDVLLLWVDGAGLPLAARRTKELKARIVVISFEVKEKEELQFAHVSDRLVVTKRTTDSSGSGLGQKESGTKTIAVTVGG